MTTTVAVFVANCPPFALRLNAPAFSPSSQNTPVAFGRLSLRDHFPNT